MVIVSFDSMPRYPVYIWDLSSNSFRKINSFLDLYLWHLDVDEGILVAFEINWDTCPPEVQQTKWSLTGQLLDKKGFHLSLLGRYPDRELLESSRFKPSDWISYTHCHRTMRTLAYYEPYEGYAEIDLFYDFSIDKLSVRWDAILPACCTSVFCRYSLPAHCLHLQQLPQPGPDS